VGQRFLVQLLVRSDSLDFSHSKDSNRDIQKRVTFPVGHAMDHAPIE